MIKEKAFKEKLNLNTLKNNIKNYPIANRQTLKELYKSDVLGHSDGNKGKYLSFRRMNLK